MNMSVTLFAATSVLAVLSSTLRSQSLEPVAFFDGSANEYPESIAIDHRGNSYLSLVFAGKIRKVTPRGVQSDFAHIPDNWLLGMTFDRAGNLVVLGASGIWKVSPDGTPSLFSSVPGHNFLNDLVYDRHGNLYVTDSLNYLIWRVDPQGTAVVWSTDALLQPSVSIFPAPLGPNGIGFDHAMKTLHVLNTTAGRVLLIDVQRNGSAGPARILADDLSLIGADGLAIDDHDNTFITVNIQDRIAVVKRNGRVSTVIEGDLLSVPTSLAFGSGCDSRTLFICNNGLFFTPEPFGAGLLRLDRDDGERSGHGDHNHR
jgi:sugar lactone lactonase YvrE